ncbi:MAG: hypothetical protein RR844_04160 [Clostridium sp.]
MREAVIPIRFKGFLIGSALGCSLLLLSDVALVVGLRFGEVGELWNLNMKEPPKVPI